MLNLLLVKFLMNRKNLLFLFLLVFLTGYGFSVSAAFGRSFAIKTSLQDPLKENQILYNGKVWRNLFTNVKGDQFLFSKDYLPGSVTISGKSYKNLNINYDIYTDEITTPKNNGAILQLNKEMIDSFTLFFDFKKYLFKNTQIDSLSGIKGYVNVLYNGKSALYVKYRKEIDLLAVDEKFDLFYQTHKIYFVKKGTVYQLTGKGDLLKALKEDKAQIKTFMKKNRLRVSKKLPESFIPVIRYYDSLSQ